METEWLTAIEAAQYLKVSRARCSSGYVKKDPAHRYPACGAVSGDSASMSWMLFCVRHPLTC